MTDEVSSILMTWMIVGFPQRTAASIDRHAPPSHRSTRREYTAKQISPKNQPTQKSQTHQKIEEN
jgi:hypothetical protein